MNQKKLIDWFEPQDKELLAYLITDFFLNTEWAVKQIDSTKS